MSNVRLPRHLVPELYKVRLIPFIIPDNYTIRGDVAATLECVIGGSDNITLHIADMTIDHGSVKVSEEATGASVGVAGHEYDKDREFYIARLDRNLEKGKKYVIQMDFVGKLSASLKGFYRSTYKNEVGKDV